MSRIQAAKYSFAGGVRTPRVSLRSDHNPYTDRDTYNESLEIGNNWIITPQGGIQFRRHFVLTLFDGAHGRIPGQHIVGDSVQDFLRLFGLCQFPTGESAPRNDWE